MTVSQTTALAAFYVSGANATIEYLRYITPNVPDIPMYVSNSSLNVYLDVIPTSSLVGLDFFRVDNSLINESSPLRLYPRTAQQPSGSLIPVIARVNSSNFNNIGNSIQKEYNISFKIFARLSNYTPPVSPASSAPGTNTGAGPGSSTGGTTPPADPTAVPPPPPSAA